ncbi:hypothetical protein SY83_12730 [Paenibacillus swuensis]|uniref:Peptidase S1 n=1 Tax=Paenibacillus swuensis TaxID=1178515 RepID=A0A172TIW1_9BACL|nr:serine protease [Paenibacillus swuensis]ANE46995.1 hypothetical protein SY83_12730 [Paenibacillus swuensis]
MLRASRYRKGVFGASIKRAAIYMLVFLSGVIVTQMIFRTAEGHTPILSARDNVVRILAVTGSGEVTAGSGWLVGEREHSDARYVVTSYHVTVNGEALYVQQQGKTIEAVPVAADPLRDLIVLGIAEPLPGRSGLRLSDYREAEPTEQLWALGFPAVSDTVSGEMSSNTEEVTITNGIVSRMAVDPAGRHIIQMTAPINNGSSGGPVLNGRGEVIGVNTFKALEDSQGVFGAVHKDELIPLLKDAGVQRDYKSVFSPLSFIKWIEFIPVVLWSGLLLLWVFAYRKADYRVYRS